MRYAVMRNNHTPAVSGQHCPTLTPAGTPSILRRHETNVNVNLGVRFEGAEEVVNEDMQGNERGNEGGVQNPYARVQQPTDIVSRLRPTINKIKQLLDGAFKQVFVKSRQAYKHQVLLNEQFLRMLKTEKRLTMKDKAGKVSAALQAEGTASARTTKVIIVDALKDAKKNEKKSKQAKKANDKKGDKESKTRRGPQTVAPMQRKRHQRKIQKISQTSATQDGAGGKNNVTPAENSKKKENSSKKV